MADLKIGQEIELSNTPFADSDRKCTIQTITHKKGGLVEFRVEMTLFNIKFPNLLVTYEDTDSGSQSSDMIYGAQQKMLEIFRRKVNNKETEQSKLQDEDTLQEIFKDSNMSFPEGAMKRHYLALMLICARLMNDEQGIRRLTEQVTAELDIISNIRESKAATDSRAWLHIALFIASGKAPYRDQAKAYIRQYNPKSTYLQQFVKISCKKACEKWIGVKRNRQKKTDCN